MTITQETTYIAATIPARFVYASGTTLFHIGELEIGDAMFWVQLAEMNDKIDPWIFGTQQIFLPPVPSTAPLTGILGA